MLGGGDFEGILRGKGRLGRTLKAKEAQGKDRRVPGRARPSRDRRVGPGQPVERKEKGQSPPTEGPARARLALRNAAEITLTMEKSVPEVAVTLNYAYIFKMRTVYLLETVLCFQAVFLSER